jgi:adenylyltransferase/sulfurtransferase
MSLGGHGGSAEAIQVDEALASEQGRYHRQTLIPWWDQERVARARILVIGAGALGNEVVKSLALTGIGRVVVLDMDQVELSNLSRAVLFRASDVGRTKVECVAERALELNPELRCLPLSVNVTLEAGLGLFAWADVVIGAVDNREARVFTNSACTRTGRAWVDGGIEGLAGVVRVFEPSTGPCYECTMSATDRRLFAQRRSCAQLGRQAAAQGHVASTAVTASIIAGLQVAEAVKLLHGQPTLAGEGLHFQGLYGDFDRVGYPQRDECLGHDSWHPIKRLECRSDELSVRELLDRAEAATGAGSVVELSRDIVLSLQCPECDRTSPAHAVVGALTERDAVCPDCATPRIVDFTSYLDRNTAVDQNLTLRELGLPPFDAVMVRQGTGPRQAWLIAGDAPQVLGPLSDTFPHDNPED